MNRFQLVLRSVWYHRRLNLAAAGGMFLGTAVITGALCLGDSLRGTLRFMALRRLGRVAFALENRTLFRQDLAADLAHAEAPGDAGLGHPAAVLRASGMARRTVDGEVGVPAPAVVMGVGPEFWRLFDAGSGADTAALTGRDAAVSQSLADALGARVGDALIVSAGRGAAAPALSLFAHRGRDETLVSFRVKIRAVLDAGPAYFSLRHDEYAPPNLFVERTWLARQLKAPNRANLILAAGNDTALAAAPAETALTAALANSATLDDYGFRLGSPGRDGRCTLQSRRLVLPAPALRLVDRAAAVGGARVMLASFFLANSIEKVGTGTAGTDHGRAVPYSVIGALPSVPTLDPLAFRDGKKWTGQLDPDEIVLNAWTARETGAAPGDRVRVRYYAMRDDGGLDAGTTVLRVRGILPMTSPVETPTLVPNYQGITDAKTLTDWDPPFPVDLRRIQPADEVYWDRYRTAPKAFVSTAFLRSLWQPRSENMGRRAEPRGPGFDWITTAVLDFAGTTDVQAAHKQFIQAFLRELDHSGLRLQFRSVRGEALAAAHGSSDFGGLFLGMSMFLIAAAILFAGLAIRLNATRRAREAGILLATGWGAKTVRRLLLIESTLTAVVAGALGLPAGIGYAWLLIHGVNTRWRGIVGRLPSLQLHGSAITLTTGAGAGIAVGLLAAVWGGRLLTRRRPVALLSGWQALAGRPQPHLGRWSWLTAVTCMTTAAAFAGLALAGRMSAEAAFFLVGAALLTGFLAAFAGMLARWRGTSPSGDLSLGRLARRGLARYWLRNLLVAGVVACAVFLLITVAANERRVQPEDLAKPNSPAGGFGLWIQSALPIRKNLPQALAELGLPDPDKAVVEQARFFPCRVSEGDAVSCLNVQKPAAPRVLGLPPAMIRRGGFRFRVVDAQQQAAAGGAWEMLELDPGSGVIPGFADADSAQWILHKSLGDEIAIPTAAGRTVRVRLVGLLEPGIFAGELLVGEQNFLRYFGDTGGYRVFLAAVPGAMRKQLVRVLRQYGGDYGLRIRTTEALIQAFLSVQNTYLATFGTLGGIALALGILGIVLLLLRQVEERRADIALFAALGFHRRSSALLLVRETVWVLMVGAIVGVACGLAAVGPHLAREHLPVPWGNIVWAPTGALVLGTAAVFIATRLACRRRLLESLRAE